MPEFMIDALNWLPSLLSGLSVSLMVTAASLALGIPLGFALSLMVLGPSRVVRVLALGFVELGRGVPALVLLQFAYFGLPTTGLTLSSMAASVLALTWTTGAYTSEIIRAALQSVPKGQYEAAVAVRFSATDTLRFVIVPQAAKVASPALLGFAILIFQSTSLCFTIALPELISNAYEIGTNTFRYFPVLVLAGLLYLSICIPATLLVNYVEAKVDKA